METVFLIVFAVTFVILLKLVGKTRQERLLDALPGPSGYPVVGNFFDILQTREHYLISSMEFESKFGGIYKTWIGSTPLIHISKVRYVETLFNTKETTLQSDKSSLITKSLKSHPFNMLMYKEIIFSLLNLKCPQSMINIAVEKCKILVKAIQDRLVESDVLNREIITLGVLDTIIEIILGVNIKSQIGKNIFVTSLLSLNKLSKENHRARFYSDALFRMTSYGKEFTHHLKVVQAFLNDIIMEKKRRRYSLKKKEDENGNITDILDDLLNCGEAYTDSIIQNEILSIITTALDSIDMSVNSVLTILGQQVTSQEKIRKEIQTVCARKMDNTITIKHLQKMLYFDRVVKETLRLYPPCPFILRELQKDVKIGNYLIPSGTTTCIQVVNLHRDPEFFPSQENFDPDHFLPHKVEKRSRMAFIPFGIPEGICIGQKLTEIIQRTVLTYIIWNFKMKTIERSLSSSSVNSYINIHKLDVVLQAVNKS